MEAQGYEVIEIEYDTTLNYYSMRSEVKQQLDTNGVRPNDIVVGHSMGGIIANDLKTGKNFRLITINSPSARKGYNVSAINDPLSILDLFTSEKLTIQGHRLENSDFDQYIESGE